MLNGIIMSFSMYTTIPMPQNKWEEKNFPFIIVGLSFVGLVIGLIWFFISKILINTNISITINSTIICLIPLFLSGFIHIDGYMDTCDAIFSRASLEKKYKVPMFFDNETKEVAWPANDVFVMSNIHPEKSLETQVTAIYDELNKKTVSMTPITVTPTVEFQGEQNIVDPTIVQPVAVVQKDAAEHVIVPPAEEPGKKVGSINPNIKLFDSLLRGNSVFTGDSLSVYDGTGTVISKQIVNPRVNAAPEHRTVVEFGLGIGSGINPGSVSIGGINPLKPKAFFDSSGHEWESKESYDTVMREIFGSDYEQDLGDDLGSRKK